MLYKYILNISSKNIFLSDMVNKLWLTGKVFKEWNVPQSVLKEKKTHMWCPLKEQYSILVQK